MNHDDLSRELDALDAARRRLEQHLADLAQRRGDGSTATNSSEFGTEMSLEYAERRAAQLEEQRAAMRSEAEKRQRFSDFLDSLDDPTPITDSTDPGADKE